MESELIDEEGCREAGLSESQIAQIRRLLELLLKSNEFSLIPEDVTTCPKCGMLHPHLIRGGHAGNGTPLLKCSSCGRRFVRANGHLTFHSHKDEHVWKEMMVDTISHRSLRSSAERLSINLKTAFFMRHKILEALDREASSSRMGCGETQADETYVHASHKGTKDKDHPELAGRHRRRKRGISNQQVCIFSCVDDEGSCYLEATNVGHATLQDAYCLRDHLTPRSILTVDGTTVYGGLAGEMELLVRNVDAGTDEGKTCLGRINSLHSRFKEYYRNLRGVATRYINRYCNAFIAFWNLMDEKSDATRIGNMSAMIRGRDIYLSRKSVLTYNIFQPENIEYAR